MKILISAGGSGGHIMPAVAIAHALQNLGAEIHYMGNVNSMEERIARQENFLFYPIDVQKLYRRLTYKHFAFSFKLVKSIIRAKKVIKEQKIDAFVGTGGFVSGPAGWAASICQLPIFIQEQNSFPGITNRLLARKASIIYTGMCDVAKINKAKCQYFGNPISYDESPLDKKKLVKKYNLIDKNKTILILGGSQGSVALNKVIAVSLTSIKAMNYNVLWQAGEYSLHKYQAYSCAGVHVFGFSREIQDMYKLTDLAICRGGALSMAELESYQIPAISIPLPTSAENHQLFNGRELEARGIGLLLEQRLLDKDSLIAKLNTMEEKYKKMKDNFGESTHVTAAAKIAQSIYAHVSGVK